MVLERLLGSVALASFMENHFLRFPFARAGGCQDWLTWDAWGALQSILTRPALDLLIGRQDQRWDGPPPTSLAAARALLAQGYTLGIRHAECHDATLAALAAGFHQDFQAPINIHLYCTPAGHPGFGWHYDPEEVFVLQCQGTKEWELRKNTVNPWPLVETLPTDMRYEREITPVLRCTLAPGDWLYIPGGYWHRTQAGEDSLSLSVGVLSPTALDIHDFLRDQLLSSLRWRQRLPPRGAACTQDRTELLHCYRVLFRELGEDLAALLQREDLVQFFLRAHLGEPQVDTSAPSRPSSDETTSDSA